MKTIRLDYNTLKGKIYFMSDLHYNHKNMIDIAHRPFESIDEMNDYIRGELYSTLTSDDMLFDLGDLIWRENETTYKELRDSIPCGVYKILGNHDDAELYTRFKRADFRLVEQYLNLSIKNTPVGNLQISLFHFPIEDFDHMYHGGLHLFGHVHGSLDGKYSKGGDPKLMVDVGFDSALAKKAGSFLISLEEIIKHFQDKTEGEEFRNWAKRNY